MNSLQGRLVTAVSLVLVAFLGATGFALERAFSRTGTELVREALRAQVFALLAAAEQDERGNLIVPEALPEPRYSVAGSGLYGRITDAGGVSLWRSQSLLDLDPELPVPDDTGVELFREIAGPSGETLFALSYRVQWEQADLPVRSFVFQLAESRAGFDARLTRFRQSLWGWLVAAAAGLLAAQMLILTWILRPLRRLGEQIEAIEHGQAQRLETALPRELAALAVRMNQLIEVGRRRLERHRNALSDLAHRLKTPLSVLRSTAETNRELAPGLRATITDTVAQLDESIAYHLRRATAAGESPLLPRTEVVAVVNRLRETMLKVHTRPQLRIQVTGPAAVHFRVDPGDLMEVLGNLMDNACKWAHGQVEVSLELTGREDHTLSIHVDDDGPGIPAQARFRVLARGGRADEHTPGHGIGLSVVHDIVEGAYGGRVLLAQAPLGGTRISVCFPALPPHLSPG